MSYAPTHPLDVPPYQLQPLISAVSDGLGRPSSSNIQVRCAQALGSEIYIGCSNGELLRFALQVQTSTSPKSPESPSYTLLSRQSLPNDKSIDEIVLIPSLGRALVLCDRQIHFYTLPALDPLPPQLIKPIRNVVTFAVDEQHIRRPPLASLAHSGQPESASSQIEPVEFCVIKRSSIQLFALREKLLFQKEIPLPNGATLARRTSHYLCVADKENYNMIDLNAALMSPILPLSQAYDSPAVVKPHIIVISENEFLILSWTGASTLGVFVTGEGDPVRGTLEWGSHPLAVCLDYPYITTLLPNNTIEIHSIETQSIVQVVSAPPESPAPGSPTPADRIAMVWSAAGYVVPSNQQLNKLKKVGVKLKRVRSQAGGTEASDSQVGSGEKSDKAEVGEVKGNDEESGDVEIEGFEV